MGKKFPQLLYDSMFVASYVFIFLKRFLYFEFDIIRNITT